MLRLNVAVPPASKPNPLGVVGGDLAGYPNGRRIIDDVTTISIRAVDRLGNLSEPAVWRKMKN